VTAAACAACSSTPDASADLDAPGKKDLAMRLVSSAENSSLDWKAQYTYIQDINDGRGYTAGTIGFCTACGDLLHVVENYSKARPDNPLTSFLPALRHLQDTGSDSHDGLGDAFVKAWHQASTDTDMRKAQDVERDKEYFRPAVSRAKKDGLSALGQFIYYDAIVMHGNGNAPTSFGSIRERALDRAEPPARGGDETDYLNAFLDARVWAMDQEKAHQDTSRVDTEQRVFLDKGNLNLDTPLSWKVYGDSYHM
jgi:chitosanase